MSGYNNKQLCLSDNQCDHKGAFYHKGAVTLAAKLFLLCPLPDIKKEPESAAGSMLFPYMYVYILPARPARTPALTHAPPGPATAVSLRPPAQRGLCRSCRRPNQLIGSRPLARPQLRPGRGLSWERGRESRGRCCCCCCCWLLSHKDERKEKKRRARFLIILLLYHQAKELASRRRRGNQGFACLRRRRERRRKGKGGVEAIKVSPDPPSYHP